MNSVLVDTSFLISLCSPSRTHHIKAKEYYQRFISTGVSMHLSTIAISEFEVKQRIVDLGLHNFIVTPFNYEDAISTAKIFTKMHEARTVNDERDAVKDDSKLLGQCIIHGISHFVTGDGQCAKRINNIRNTSYIPNLPYAIDLNDEFCESWFSKGNQGTLLLSTI